MVIVGQALRLPTVDEPIWLISLRPRQRRQAERPPYKDLAPVGKATRHSAFKPVCSARNRRTRSMIPAAVGSSAVRNP